MRSHLILFVADLARSRAFYREVLACEPSLDVPGMTEFPLPGGAVLGLMPRSGARRILGEGLVPEAATSGASGELYLVVDDPAAFLARAVDAGARDVSPLQARDWGHEAGYLTDPDGHVLAFAREAAADAVRVRLFREDDAMRLRAVFQSSIRAHAPRDYTPEQVEAWAEGRGDADAFAERMRRLRPFVAEAAGEPVGYADLQDDGLIDHFYVAGGWGGRGVGAALMERIHADARARGIRELRADVSRTAEPFFLRHGFEGGEEQAVDVDGVILHNRPMCKLLEAGP